MSKCLALALTAVCSISSATASPVGLNPAKRSAPWRSRRQSRLHASRDASAALVAFAEPPAVSPAMSASRDEYVAKLIRR